MIEAHASWPDVPLPRLYASLGYAGEVFLGVELSSRHGNPILEATWVGEWRRPRPWLLDGYWPNKYPGSGRRFQWRPWPHRRHKGGLG